MIYNPFVRNKNRILVACDSFKGSLTSFQIANIAKKTFYDAEVLLISDGGEGFTETIINNKKIQSLKIKTVDDMNNDIQISVGVENTKAYLDVASIVGLHNYPSISAMKKTTRGLGIVLRKLENMDFIKRVFIGLGGSSTNDAGFYASLEMGFKYLDENNKEIIKLDQADRIQKIIKPPIKNRYYGFADVKNKLLGNNGSTQVFGKQKWLSPKEIIQCEKNIVNYCRKNSWRKTKKMGSGAAGGLGFFVVNNLNGKIKLGIKELIKFFKIKKKIRESSFVITGEGKFDNQSLMGKAPIEIAKIAGKKKSILVAGIINAKKKYINKFFKLSFQLKSENQSLQEAMKNAKIDLHKTFVKIKKIIDNDYNKNSEELKK